MLIQIKVNAANTQNPAVTSIKAVTVCETPEIVGVCRAVESISCLSNSPELQGKECEDNTSSVTVSRLCCVSRLMM